MSIHLDKANRREPKFLPSITPNECDFCGAKTANGRKYCSPEHRAAYNNLCAKEGKVIVQAAKLWAKHRGKSGTPGAGMLQVIRDAADDFNRDARNRKSQHTAPQNASTPVSGDI